jgi:WD40 repeat protein
MGPIVQAFEKAENSTYDPPAVKAPRATIVTGKGSPDYPPMSAPYKYFAFISYSHQDNRARRPTGESGRVAWGTWLQEALETYRVPPELAGQVRAGNRIPDRIFPIFRDETELPTTADLGRSIREALTASRFLIVVCSPRSTASLYCNEEVRLFKELGRADRILPVIVDGEPNAVMGNKPGVDPLRECFPPALRHPLNPDHTLDVTRRDVEPICADARVGDDRHEPSAREWAANKVLPQRVLLKLAAGMLGVGYDDLIQRDQQRQLDEARSRARRARRLTAAFAIISALAIGAGIYANQQRLEAGERLQDLTRSVALRLFDDATKAQAGGDTASAVALLSRAMQMDPEGPAGELLLHFLAYGGIRPPLHTLELAEEIRAMGFATEGPLAVTVSGESMRAWHGRTGEPLGPPIKAGAAIQSARISPDGAQLLSVEFVQTGTSEAPGESHPGHSRMRLWNPRTGEAITPPVVVPGDLQGEPVFGAGDRRVLYGWGGLDDGRVQVWDLATGRPVGKVVTLSAPIGALAWSPARDGLVLTVELDGKGSTRLWDGHGRRYGVTVEHPGGASSAAFSPDGETIISGGWDGKARLWGPFDLNKGVIDVGAMVQDVAISASGRVAMVLSEKNISLWPVDTLRAYAADTATKRSRLERPRALVELPGWSHAVLSPDERSIATFAGRSIAWWDMMTVSPRGTTVKVEPAFGVVAFGADGSRVVAGYDDGTVRVLDMATGRAIGPVIRHAKGRPITAVAISRDGRRALTATGGHATLWDLEQGVAIGKPLRHREDIREMALSADGTRAVTGTSRMLHRWDLARGVPMGEPIKMENFVNGLAFHPGGARFAVAVGSTVERRDTLSGEPSGDPIRLIDDAPTTDLAFSPDGGRIAVGTKLGAQVFAADSGQALTPMLHGGDEAWCRVTFSGDGRRLLTRSADGTLLVSDAHTGRPRSHRMVAPSRTDAVALDASGTRVHAATDLGTFTTLRLPKFDAGATRAMAEFVEALWGMRANEAGVATAIAADDPRQLALLRELPAAARSVQVTDATPDFDRIRFWLFSSPEVRTVDPWSPQKVADCTAAGCPDYGYPLRD